MRWFVGVCVVSLAVAALVVDALPSSKLHRRLASQRRSSTVTTSSTPVLLSTSSSTEATTYVDAELLGGAEERATEMVTADIEGEGEHVAVAVNEFRQQIERTEQTERLTEATTQQLLKAEGAADIAADAAVGAMTMRRVRITFQNVGGNAPVAANFDNCRMNLRGANGDAQQLFDGQILATLKGCLRATPQLGGPNLPVSVIDSFDQTWIHSLTMDNGGGAQAVAWGNAMDYVTADLRAVFTLVALNTVSADFYTLNAAADNHVVPCLVGPNVAGFRFDALHIARCALALKPRHIALEPSVHENDFDYPYTTADVQGGAPGVVNTQFAATNALTIKIPVRIDVVQNVPGGMNIQNTLVAWVDRVVAATNNNAFRDAINTVLTLARRYGQAAIGSTNPGHAAYDAIVEHNYNNAGGASTIVLWNANAPDVTHPIRVEYFVGGFSRHWFPVILQSYQPPVSNVPGATMQSGYFNVPITDNMRVDTRTVTTPAGSEEVIYINCVSGAFRDDPVKRLAAATALATAANLRLDQLVAAQLLIDLVADNQPARNGISRVMSRELQIAHGVANKHWGFAYFKVTVKMFGAITRDAAVPLTKHIGWVCAGDNLPYGLDGRGNGPGVHTEQRCLEQLRRFVLALEQPVQGVQMQVTALASRWITDFFPDTQATNNCEWAFKYVQHAAAQGWFRGAVYNDEARLLGNDDKTRSAFGVNRHLLRMVGAPDRAQVIAWTLPVGHNIYQDHQHRTASYAINAGQVPDTNAENAQAIAQGPDWLPVVAVLA